MMQHKQKGAWADIECGASATMCTPRAVSDTGTTILVQVPLLYTHATTYISVRRTLEKGQRRPSRSCSTTPPNAQDERDGVKLRQIKTTDFGAKGNRKCSRGEHSPFAQEERWRIERSTHKLPRSHECIHYCWCCIGAVPTRYFPARGPRREANKTTSAPRSSKTAALANPSSALESSGPRNCEGCRCETT